MLKSSYLTSLKFSKMRKKSRVLSGVCVNGKRFFFSFKFVKRCDPGKE